MRTDTTIFATIIKPVVYGNGETLEVGRWFQFDPNSDLCDEGIIIPMGHGVDVLIPFDNVDYKV